MPVRSDHAGPARFARSALPWLIAAGMLAVYALTLNRWVTPNSVREIARLSGLTWQIDLGAPVTWLATYPFRWLPAARIPLAANFFSALCAVGVLGFLARSVALLPYDRTQQERQRNSREPYVLNIPAAWLPPILAALACGLQLTFWEHAVAATGEMLDLLLFAYLVRCVLEYRIDQKKSWLLRWALVDGIAVANNWVMVAFLPLFLAGLFWVSGLAAASNAKTLAPLVKNKFRSANPWPAVQMLGCWLAGASLIFLMPAIAQHAPGNHPSFWTALGVELRVYYFMLTAFPLSSVALLSLTSVLPVVFLAIRWGRVLGGLHRWSKYLSHTAFYGIHGFFLLACAWTAFDSRFSPRHLQPAMACLPLYFLGALSIGRYGGYFLLVFSGRTGSRRRRRSVSSPLRSVMIGLVCALAIAVPALLMYKNLPHILVERDSSLAHCCDVMQQNLPSNGAIVLSEDPVRLEYLETSLIRRGRQPGYLLIDATLLPNHADYAQFLDRRHPEFKLSQTTTNQFSEMTNSIQLVFWLKNLGATHDIYVMHPFTGLLAELFYQQPRGLFYQLKDYPGDSSRVPPLETRLVEENRSFWRNTEAEHFPPILRRIEHSAHPASHTLMEKIGNALRLPQEADPAAVCAGGYYSMMLNGWGVELQRQGLLAEAGKCFEQARQLNPENTAAEINQHCNRDLQAHKQLTVDPVLAAQDQIGRNRDWDQSLRLDGPTDGPNTCSRLGMLFADARMVRQSIRQYERVEMLAPGDTNAPLRLAELFLKLGEYTNALASAGRALELAPGQPHALVMKGLSLVYLRRFYQAIPPLNEALNSQADNPDARIARGLAYLNMGKLLAAREDYERAAQASPNAYPAYFGLAEIAYRRREIPDTIKNCELYLSHGPTEGAEVEQIKAWLEESKNQSKN
jgi:tetratricopeptide (TPR) repeat protein